MAPDAVVLNLHTDALEVICNGEYQRRRPTTRITVASFAPAVELTQPTPTAYPSWRKLHCTAWPHQLPNSHCARLQVKKSKLPPNFLRKRGQKLRGISDVPPQRIADLDNATRQLRQLSCILDSCTISTSYEGSQAQKALLLLPRTEKGSSTSSDERYEEHDANLPNLPHEDYWLEAKHT